jgi:hypothetical protein
MTCQAMSVALQRKWANRLALQQTQFDEQSYAEMLKESEEIEAFCNAATTFEAAMECMNKALEF